METASKTCTKCLLDQPLDQYGTQKSSPDGLRYECKTCQRQYMAEWRSRNRPYLREAAQRRWQGTSDEEKARKRSDDLKRYYADPEAAREKLLHRKYGITLAQYNEMLSAQNNACAICGEVPDERILHVDHHHDTGAVRGLLCSNCNLAIGLFRDSPEFLTQAIAYLLNT